MPPPYSFFHSLSLSRSRFLTPSLSLPLFLALSLSLSQTRMPVDCPRRVKHLFPPRGGERVDRLQDQHGHDLCFSLTLQVARCGGGLTINLTISPFDHQSDHDSASRLEAGRSYLNAPTVEFQSFAGSDF